MHLKIYSRKKLNLQATKYCFLESARILSLVFFGNLLQFLLTNQTIECIKYRQKAFFNKIYLKIFIISDLGLDCYQNDIALGDF